MAERVHVPKFDHTMEDWKIYKTRLPQIFNKLDIKDTDENAETKMKSVLLDCLDRETYGVLYGIVDPVIPFDKTYMQLVELMDEHFATTTIVYVERKAFFRAQKAEDESVQDYLTRIRKMASKCAFGNRLEALLVDIFITGMSGKVFDKLSEKESWTLIEAVSMAKKYEVKTYKSDELSTEVNWVNRKESVQMRKYNERGTREITSPVKCEHCGFKNHVAIRCKFKNATCYGCNKKGHLMSMCKEVKINVVNNSTCMSEVMGNTKVGRGATDVKEEGQEILSIDDKCERVCSAGLMDKSNPFLTKINILGKIITFQIDSGAGVSAIPARIFFQKFPSVELLPDITTVKSYGGDKLKVLGAFEPKIVCNGLAKKLRILIIENASIPIVGRNFIKDFKIKVMSINNVVDSSVNIVDHIVQDYNELFDGKIGKLKGVLIKLEMNEAAEPKCMKARPVPHAFRDVVERQLQDLERQGIITRVDTAEWGTPLVPILKADGSVRICADYRITINPYLKDVNHPLPRISEILTKLQGNKIFSTIDLARAYNQIELEENSRSLVAWSTHVGMFLMNRLPFGIKPATGIFQREIEKILRGIPGVINFLDDIIIAAPDLETHNVRLRQVLERLKKANLKVNKNKCVFAKTQLNFLGNIVSEEGIRKPSNKEAVLEAPQPTDVKQLRSFCGMVNYYGKFIPNLATKMSPLYNLLKKGVDFVWSENCQRAFDALKEDIVSDTVLTHYDPKLPLLLTCDASAIGIGALISHVFPDGTEKPIEFASRILSKAEINYGMIQKEALAIIYGTNKFFQYLIGRTFTIVTDHKPLLGIFGAKKGIPQMSASRMQRWALHLSGFNFDIKYVGSDKNAADMLSRMPIGKMPSVEYEEGEATYLCLVQSDSELKIDFDTVVAETTKDEDLVNVMECIKAGRFDKIKMGKLQCFYEKRDQLSVEKNILMWGYRIVVPDSLRNKILKQVHETHMGMVKTKSILRSYVWWPGMDKDIERWIKSCEACLAYGRNPNKMPSIAWPEPNRPWGRIHMDYGGPIKGYYFLIIIDARTKWIEVFCTKEMTTSFTLRKLQEVFARFGFPDEVVSDNGRQFVSEEFKMYLSKHSIMQKLTAPGYPATNGAAENAVKTIKNAIKKALFEKPDANVEMVLNRFLFDYRNTNHSTTGKAPAKELLGYKPRVKLDALKCVEYHESCGLGKELYRNSIERGFIQDDVVMVRDYRIVNKPGWQKAVVAKVLGRRNYLCKLESGRFIKRHINQMVQRVVRSEEEYGEQDNKAELISKQRKNSDKVEENYSVWFIKKRQEAAPEENESRGEECGGGSEYVEVEKNNENVMYDCIRGASVRAVPGVNEDRELEEQNSRETVEQGCYKLRDRNSIMLPHRFRGDDCDV